MRDTIVVRRRSEGWPERWRIEVEEDNRFSKPVWHVRGVLEAIERPERWCLETSAMLPADDLEVPGVVVDSGDPFQNLAVARNRAARLAATLAGRRGEGRWTLELVTGSKSKALETRLTDDGWQL